MVLFQKTKRRIMVRCKNCKHDLDSHFPNGGRCIYGRHGAIGCTCPGFEYPDLPADIDGKEVVKRAVANASQIDISSIQDLEIITNPDETVSFKISVRYDTKIPLKNLELWLRKFYPWDGKYMADPY